MADVNVTLMAMNGASLLQWSPVERSTTSLLQRRQAERSTFPNGLHVKCMSEVSNILILLYFSNLILYPYSGAEVITHTKVLCLLYLYNLICMWMHSRRSPPNPLLPLLRR